MSIKSQGGVFGRNPTFNDVTVEGDLSIAGTLAIGGETITGLSYQGGWNASTNTPDIAASSPVTGQFWIVSADGSTDVGGITNWTSGDWALYDGSAWQRVEGGNTDLSTGVQGQLAVANGGTGAADASTARANLSAASSAQGALADTALQPADIGSTVQGYDADTAKYDDTTANFTGTLQKSGNAVLTTASDYLDSSDIGSTVQAYDADTTKNDVSNSFTQPQAFTNGSASNPSITITGDTDTGIYFPAANQQALSCGGTETVRTYFIAGAYGILRVNGSGSATFPNFTFNGDDNTGMYRATTDTLAFSTGGTERLRINSGGGLDVSAGNISVDSGYGIDFSATSGTGTSELLDDYEEGTWTPAYQTTNGNFAGSFPTAWGKYTKIGNVVYFSFYIESVSVSSVGTGNLLITGLPFSSGSAETYFIHQFEWVSTSTPPTAIFIASGASQFSVLTHSSTSVYSQLTDLASSNVSTTNFRNDIIASGFYFV